MAAAAAVALAAVAVAAGSTWALFAMLLLSMVANLLLAALSGASSRRAALLEKLRAWPVPQERSDVGDGPALGAAAGLQRLVNAAWAGARDAVAQAEFVGTVRRVELSETLPRVVAVREAESPADRVVCYEIDAAWHDGATLLAVDLDIKLLGTLRIKLMGLESTVQFYCWSLPPTGRGDGTPYSLIEASFSSAPPRPPVVAVELEAGESSALLKRMIPQLQQVAAAVVDEILLPRLTGFQHRLAVVEVPVTEQHEAGEDGTDESWQKAARRAGWLPRAEAELENAVGEMLRRATDYAWEQASGASDALQGKLAAGLEAGQWARGLVSDAASGAAAAVSDAAAGAATVVQKPTEQVAAAGQWATQLVSGAAAGAVTAIQNPSEQAAQAARAAAGAAAGVAGKFGLSLDMLRSSGQSPKTPGTLSETPTDAQLEQPQL